MYPVQGLTQVDFLRNQVWTMDRSSAVRRSRGRPIRFPSTQSIPQIEHQIVVLPDVAQTVMETESGSRGFDVTGWWMNQAGSCRAWMALEQMNRFLNLIN